MASTTFVDGQTVIEAAWLNDVNAVVYTPGTTTAADVANVPAGNIASTNVQAAINELDSEKQPLDNELTALSTATAAADKIPYFTGTTTAGTLTWNSASALANGATTVSSNTVIKTAIDAMDIETQVAPSTVGNVLTSNGTIWTSTAKITAGTVVPYTSATNGGTTIDYSSIPSWVKRITFMVVGLSVSGASNLRIQVGTGGTPTTSGYLGSYGLLFSTTNLVVANLGSGFDVSASGGTGTVYHGSITLSKLDATNHVWVASGNIGQSDTARISMLGGSIDLSGALDFIRFTTANGTDTFDAGSVNILYE